jgi:hypothetical protein
MIEVVPLGMFAAIAVIFCTMAVQLGGVRKARAQAQYEAEYRELLRQSNEAQTRMSEVLDRAVTEIAALRTRVESTERLLQDVG